jgi:hypothetical protein
MLTMTYLEFFYYTLGQMVVYVSAGIALACWWKKPPAEPWTRTMREYEQDRFGSAMDGTLSRVRWLPGAREGSE